LTITIQVLTSLHREKRYSTVPRKVSMNDGRLLGRMANDPLLDRGGGLQLSA
jgi:hypothetical protein